jgi:hypothetical protein
MAVQADGTRIAGLQQHLPRSGLGLVNYVAAVASPGATGMEGLRDSISGKYRLESTDTEDQKGCVLESGHNRFFIC